MNHSGLTRRTAALLLVATMLLSAIAPMAVTADNNAVDYAEHEGPRIAPSGDSLC
jgi:hypothetical protein